MWTITDEQRAQIREAMHEKFENIVLTNIRRGKNYSMPNDKLSLFVKTKIEEALLQGFKKDNTLVSFVALCAQYDLLQQQPLDKELRTTLQNMDYTPQQKLTYVEQYARIYG